MVCHYLVSRRAVQTRRKGGRAWRCGFSADTFAFGGGSANTSSRSHGLSALPCKWRWFCGSCPLDAHFADESISRTLRPGSRRPLGARGRQLLQTWRSGHRRPAHDDRHRAEAFGLAADDYDRYRPRYPCSLIDGLIENGHLRALDVGAGTGVASAQLLEAGAEVLAVEPDSRMARVATSKGIRVEQATFDDWQPAGRSFDLVVFAQSFHWVEPQRALQKVASILRPGGRLALLSNRLTPVSPTRQELDEAYAGVLDASQRPPIDAVHDEELMEMIREHGYSTERRHVTERFHYTTDGWVNMMFTHSNVLTLDPVRRSQLRSRLEQRIAVAGVDAEDDATAVVFARLLDATSIGGDSIGAAPIS